MTASLWFPPGICLESNLQPTAHKHTPLQTGCRGPHPSEEPPSLPHPERHSRSSPSGDGFGSDCHITRCYIPPWGLRLRDNVFQEVGAVGSRQVFGAATWRLHVRTLRVSRQTLLSGVALAYGSPPLPPWPKHKHCSVTGFLVSSRVLESRCHWLCRVLSPALALRNKVVGERVPKQGLS